MPQFAYVIFFWVQCASFLLWSFHSSILLFISYPPFTIFANTLLYFSFFLYIFSHIRPFFLFFFIFFYFRLRVDIVHENVVTVSSTSQKWTTTVTEASKLQEIENAGKIVGLAGKLWLRVMICDIPCDVIWCLMWCVCWVVSHKDWL